MVDLCESAERRADVWSHIRHHEAVLEDFAAIDVFLKTLRYNGEQLPVAARPETFQQIKLLLTNELVRLRQAAQ